MKMLYKKKEYSMKNFYCEYCGQKYPSVAILTSSTCPKHPSGTFKGKHKLYEGTEKIQYTCKFCGTKASSISLLVGGTCPRHQKGSFKGNHSPAL